MIMRKRHTEVEGNADATALGAIVKQAVPHAPLAMTQAARFILRGMIFSENRFPLFRIMP
jgi:hypothetical protein